MEGIHEILNALYSDSHHEGDVLATIIHVEGSAYQKEGTTMLFRSDGTQIGMLSAGCLETDLSYRVQEARNGGTVQTVIYDLREEGDLSWGQGAGCNGAIHVLLEPVDAFLHDHLGKLKCHLDNGKRVTMIKKMTNEFSVSDYLFVSDDKHHFGKWHGSVSREIKCLLNDIHQSFPKSGIKYVTELSSTVYVHSYEPKPRLVVFGAGADAVPLVKIASLAGFSVTVLDWSSAFCNEDHFPDADRLLVGYPSETIPLLQLTRADSVLILTHQFQKNQEILKYIKGEDLRYLGVLSPRRRTQRLLEGETVISDINSPAGLSIGAEGPEEIAISIVAELIQQQRNKKQQKVMTREG
ncbi:XdhC/CoxI family protein [Bacillus sp. sid0103]|uniref:XdhC family protein n=1 Tax=Bacillus sp. sid0103 TaxID=2856337 RepID=UPI001C4542AB|nr:XdhC/CoxI family protein [Bacillus sp. sid0103]MBV7508356.1 XdhC/CoxI family protein [Bacillus sp. sid0103]